LILIFIKNKIVDLERLVLSLLGELDHSRHIQVNFVVALDDRSAFETLNLKLNNLKPNIKKKTSKPVHEFNILKLFITRRRPLQRQLSETFMIIIITVTLFIIIA
jgi:hypothetical protein